MAYWSLRYLKYTWLIAKELIQPPSARVIMLIEIGLFLI